MEHLPKVDHCMEHLPKVDHCMEHLPKVDFIAGLDGGGRGGERDDLLRAAAGRAPG